jgi:hypothetical protein
MVYMEMTIEQRKQLEDMYKDLLSGGIIMGNPTCYYIVDGKPVEFQGEWERRVKKLFGEDSEITKELTKRVTGFITGK